MGNNAAMTAFEATVIACYERGVLSRELLDALAAPYRASDIDCGGLRGLTTHDGKRLFQVIVETIRPGVVPPPEEGSAEDGPNWYGAYAEISTERWQFW